MNTAPLPAYGADGSGLIHGYVFSTDGIGRHVDTGVALSWWANREQASGEFIWLHFNGSQISTRPWIEKHLGLHEEFIDILKSAPRSTRVEQVHDGLIAILNDVLYEFGSVETRQVATVRMIVGTRYLVSVRNSPLRSVDKLRTSVNIGESFPTPLSLFNHLLRDQADVLAQIMRNTSEKVDTIEDDFLTNRIPSRSVLGALRRDLVRLQRLLAPEPAALFRLLNRPPVWMKPVDTQDLQQSTEEFSVALHDMTGLLERIKLVQEEIVAYVGERTNRSVFILTAVTVAALPINLASGLLGMNVGGVPYNQDPKGFWIVVALVGLVTAVMAWQVFRDREH